MHRSNQILVVEPGPPTVCIFHRGSIPRRLGRRHAEVEIRGMLQGWLEAATRQHSTEYIRNGQGKIYLLGVSSHFSSKIFSYRREGAFQSFQLRLGQAGRCPSFHALTVFHDFCPLGGDLLGGANNFLPPVLRRRAPFIYYCQMDFSRLAKIWS